MFAGLAIGASRTGDPVWLLAGAALALQTTRHAIDFSYPASQHQVIAAAPQPPLESRSTARAPRRAGRAASRSTRRSRAGPRRAAAAARMTLRRRLGGCGARATAPAGRWVKKIVAFPIGERFAAISITAALFSARTTFVVLLAWGGFATPMSRRPDAAVGGP